MANREEMRRRGAILLVGLALAAAGLPAGARVPAEGPRYYPQHTFERTRVKMRDGVELGVDIYRPVVPKGKKIPIVLSLTPYHAIYRAIERNESALPTGDAQFLVPRGFAYVRADVRGTYNSGGCWDYGGIKERRDGYDLVEWLAKRPWTNGRVAMTGGSYDGTTANAAAVERPPHLETIIPVSSISRWWGYAYQQGTRSAYSGEDADPDPPSDTPLDFMFAYGFIPPPDPTALSNADQIAMRWNLCDRVEKFMHGYDTEPDYDKFWKQRDYLRLAHRVRVPVLVAHGQLDFNVKTWEGTAWYERVRTQKAMFLGQWPHSSPRLHTPMWDKFLLKWLDRWLYGIRNGIEHQPGVHIQTNDGRWQMRDSWGPKRKLRLRMQGPKIFRYFDDGALTETEMVRGPANGRSLRLRVKNSSGLHIEGRPILHIVASSDSRSTHFVAVLCDVAPNGGCDVISRAFFNARYRGSLEKGRDLKPNKKYSLALQFIDKSHKVARDHHLEVRIASSSTTWVFSDEARANNTLYPPGFWLELPVR